MASKTAMRLPIAAAAKRTTALPLTARRSLATARPNGLSFRSNPSKPAWSRSAFQQSFRRAYADVAPVKKKRAGFFRWTWRLTYSSALGGLVYLGYLIYDLRTPDQQFEPDPNKKTLVILGE